MTTKHHYYQHLSSLDAVHIKDPDILKELNSLGQEEYDSDRRFYGRAVPLFDGQADYIPAHNPVRLKDIYNELLEYGMSKPLTYIAWLLITGYTRQDICVKLSMSESTLSRRIDSIKAIIVNQLGYDPESRGRGKEMTGSR